MRLAYEAADCGLLSSDLAGEHPPHQGRENCGVYLGNWITSEQSQALWQAPRGLPAITPSRPRRRRVTVSRRLLRSQTFHRG